MIKCYQFIKIIHIKSEFGLTFNMSIGLQSSNMCLRKFALHTHQNKATKWGCVSESPYKKVGPVSVLGRAR